MTIQNGIIKMKQTTVPVDVNNHRKLLTLTYAISLSVIAFMSIVVHLMLDKVITEQSKTGKIVNVSGQQRMLSQRTSLFTIEYLTLGTLESKVVALTALNKMQSNHNLLLKEHYQALESGDSSPMSITLQNMYFKEPLNVDKKLTLFTQQIHEALALEAGIQHDFNKVIKSGFLVLAKEPLLNALHTVVGQYEKESVDKVNNLRFAQNVVLVIIILTILFEAFLVFRPMVDKICKFAFQLQYEANFDHLTGLLNRRSFNLQASKVVAASHRYNRHLGVVIFDIDLFKRINDTYGHAAGDLAIKHVSTVLQDNCRTTDFVARFGGEEFVMLLPETDCNGCFHIADKIREQISTTPLLFEGKLIDLAISAGIAMLEKQHENIEEPLRFADEALYKAKENGRNLVTVYSVN
jgi:diguanylate cyclase (GGDEF)-like protein